MYIGAGVVAHNENFKIYIYSNKIEISLAWCNFSFSFRNISAMGNCIYLSSSAIEPFTDFDNAIFQTEHEDGSFNREITEEQMNYLTQDNIIQSDENANIENTAKLGHKVLISDCFFPSNPLESVILNRKSFDNPFIGILMMEDRINVAMKLKQGYIKEIDFQVSHNYTILQKLHVIKKKYKELVEESNDKMLVLYTGDILSLQEMNLVKEDFIFKYIDYSIAAIIGLYYKNNLYSLKKQDIKDGCYTVFLSLKEKLEIRFTVVKDKNIFVVKRMSLEEYSQFNRMRKLKEDMNIDCTTDEKFYKNNIDVIEDNISLSYRFLDGINYDEYMSVVRVIECLRICFMDILYIRKQMLEEFSLMDMKQYIIYLNQKVVDMNKGFLINKLTQTEIYTSRNLELISVGAGVIADKNQFPEYNFYMF